MQDLSHLSDGSLAVSSMSGGNTVSSNDAAMTAPGSEPVDPMPNQDSRADPSLTWTHTPVSVLGHGAEYAPWPAVWRETPDG